MTYLGMREFYVPAIITVAVAASVLATEIPAACPSKDVVNRTVHIAHENDPTKFYICVMGDKRAMSCPEYVPGKKLCFNPERQQCDWPINVAGCKQHLDPHCPSSEDTIAVWPHPFNCRWYYTCKNDIMNLRSCDEGWLFDPKSSNCALAAEVVCNKPTECPPTTSSEIVLLPHECQCAKYYECCDGESVLKNCDPGEMFDHDQRQCVPDEEGACDTGPTTAKPSPTTTPLPSINCPPDGNTTVIPHETSCEFYYTCENGKKQLKECKTGFSFDEIMGMCTWWEDVNCGTRTPRGTLPETDNADDTSLAECPPRGSDNSGTLPHERSCVKYYLCVDGAATLQRCEHGTEYDYIRGICDDPRNFKCIRPIPAPATTAKTAPTLTGRIATPTDTFGNLKCPFDGGKERIPHESNNRGYYYCDYGAVRLAYCLQGHYFNPVIEECDFNGNTGPVTNQTPSFGPECDGTCTVRNPDGNDCASYYECKNGNTQHKKCREGLAFNPSTEMCDLPKYVDCKKCTDTDSAIHYCACPDTAGDKFPHECQCDLYYVCKNGNAVAKPCPPGFLYDRVKKACDTADKVVCDKSPSSKSLEAPGCNGNCLVRTQDTEDCASYYECKDGKTQHKKCREGLAFNPSTEMCDLPKYVDCKKCTDTDSAIHYCACPDTTGDKFPHECQCDLYYVCKNGNAVAKPCPPGFLYDRVKKACDTADKVVCDKSPSNISLDPLGCIGACPVNNSEHRPPVTYLPHKDCANFCYCDNGTPLAYKCATGFHFSKGEQKCTDPATAQCASSFTYDDEDQESTDAKETSIWSNIPLVGELFR
ncbi:chitin-binding domain protein cbd-1 [Andrena cerasifolii]|uniref:chitin-binding domain protein cbd-1 n=1 Tax=Andrena cerasifolii TaxID=2819439 RepID=UPI004037BD92